MADPQREALAAMLEMPGASHQGPLPPLTADEARLVAELQLDVRALAEEIGPRWVHRGDTLSQTAAYLETSLANAGFTVARQAFEVEGRTCCNLDCQIPGTTRPHELVILAAHYDTIPDTPGADDNASGVAACLALARRFHGTPGSRTLRFALFANEEAPYFGSQAMGAMVYAQRCRARAEQVVAMLSLESIGYYSDAPKSQYYPPPFDRYYPSTGNFIGVVGNLDSAQLVRQVTGSFREHTRFPCEGGVLPEGFPGVGWSDHWAFWRAGYSAAMITDTAPFRNPHYHQRSDTPETLDYERMSRVVAGLSRVIAALVEC